MSDDLVRALRAVVGEAHVLVEPDRLLVYESDGLTQYRVRPAAVVLPGSGEELRAVVEALHRAGQPWVARGAGTGLSGGALASGGAVVVGTARLNRVLSVDPERRRARVEPGVVNAVLGRQVRQHGLVYAPDPSSQSACTLGGNVAENSGGPHCLKHGVTSRYVTALELVLPDGEVVRMGPDLSGLVVGSEGCFGVVREIEVALVPEAPAVRTLLAIFDSVEAAGRAVTEVMDRGLLPAALEIVDQETIRAVEASVFAAGYPVDAGAALVVEVDGVEAGLDDEVGEAAAACRAVGAREVRTARTEEERAALWAGRKKAFGAMGRIAPDLLVQDATVPRSRLPEVLARIGEIARRHELVVANVFHAGDGNLHPNLLFDRRDAEQLARVEAASGEVMDVCIEAGGTITGEHGVGLDKRKYMPRVFDAGTLQLMAEVKAAFDPEGRVNPGKVLPDEVLEAGRVAVRERGEGADVREVPGGRAAHGGTTSGVLHHAPEDLVVRVAAGTPLRELRDALADAGQWLPLDPPGGGRTRIGDVFLAGHPAPLERGFGRLRDHVLGVAGRTVGGRPFRVGGQVVKNVAGFDLIRFLCGTGDALVHLEELSLRLFPRPAADWTLLRRGPRRDPLEGWLRAAGRLPLPVAATHLAPVPDGEGWEAACRLVGSRAAVASVLRRVDRVPGGEGEVPEALEGPASEAWWEAQAVARGDGAHPATGGLDAEAAFWATPAGRRLLAVYRAEGP